MLRVLVIDDDPAQRYLFVELLKRTGYEAISVADGQEALDLLASGASFDIILSDMNMPGIHGAELLDELRRRYPKIPVVMMSVRRAEEWDLDVPKVAPMYLQKPFDRNQLAQTLNEAATKKAKRTG
jgi:CheY-like chemotaxis protein